MKQLNEQAHVLVIGAGVIGLTTAWALIEAGFRVTVVAKQFASSSTSSPKLTSQVAGALWEWPPSVCGRHKDEASLAKSKVWCMVSYRKFKELASLQAFGVRMKMSNFFFTTKVEECSQQLEKMLELQSQVDGFRHDSGIIHELGVNANYGVVDSYQHLAPVIDTDEFMLQLTKFLARRPLCSLDSSFGFINTDLLDLEEALLQTFNADIIVNCTGLGSRELAQDKLVYPLRGALLSVTNDGSRFSKVDQCFCVSLHGREAAGDMVFIIPRNDKTLIIGGIVEANDWQTHTLDKDYGPVQDMFNRSLSFLPALRTVSMSECNLSVGLRPARLNNIRLERETRLRKDGNPSKIIHNYGHGGAGFSLSFGCAENVVAIAKSILSDILEVET